MFPWHAEWGWGAWLVMTAGMLVFWGVVIWAAVSLVRGASSSGAPAAGPEETLAARFAAGEIDDDEYQRRLETLRSEKVGVRR